MYMYFYQTLSCLLPGYFIHFRTVCLLIIAILGHRGFHVYFNQALYVMYTLLLGSFIHLYIVCLLILVFLRHRCGCEYFNPSLYTMCFICFWPDLIGQQIEQFLTFRSSPLSQERRSGSKVTSSAGRSSGPRRRGAKSPCQPGPKTPPGVTSPRCPPEWTSDEWTQAGHLPGGAPSPWSYGAVRTPLPPYSWTRRRGAPPTMATPGWAEGPSSTAGPSWTPQHRPTKVHRGASNTSLPPVQIQPSIRRRGPL